MKVQTHDMKHMPTHTQICLVFESKNNLHESRLTMQLQLFLATKCNYFSHNRLIWNKMTNFAQNMSFYHFKTLWI